MLERLELVGFKSFGQKTALSFPSGITVIVGPNGSGKSNIIDALRWLLGEREAKNLRGEQAEDLIFSGTGKRSRLGMAQAAIYFDNSRQALPIEFSSVAIARRIYRDGNSEYLINKSPVRLKDLIDLFARSKMGARGLSVVGQGDSDLFIKSSPAERKGMVEEILGLRQYQLKKHDAALKLKTTQINLEKAKVATEELLPHLRLLRRQAGRLEKRAVLAAELKNLEDGYFSHKIKELKDSAQALEPNIKSVDSEIAAKKEELHLLEEDAKRVEVAKPKLLSSAGDKKFKLQREIANTEAALKFQPAFSSGPNAAIIMGLIRTIREKLVDLLKEEDIKKIGLLLQTIISDIDKILDAGKIKQNNSDQSDLLIRLKKLKEDLEKAIAEEDKGRREIESFHNSFRDSFKALSLKREEVARFNEKRNQLVFEKDRWSLKWKDLEEKIAQAGRHQRDFSVGIQLASSSFNFAEAESRMFKIRGELALVGEIDNEAVKEAREAEERYRFLSGQISDLEKASVDINNLIGDLDDKIHNGFNRSLKMVNEDFNRFFRLLFGEGGARLAAVEDGIDIELNLPGKGVKSLGALSGGEKSLVAIAALFALISVSPPPFLVFDEIDAALDEKNSRRFAELLKNLSGKTQFIVVTHNRAVMECANALYGVTMGDDGLSKLISLKLE